MIVAAILHAAAVSVLVATTLGIGRGTIEPASAALGLAAGVSFGAWSWWRMRRPRPPHLDEPPGPWEWLAIVLFALVSARAFLWLIYTEGDHIRIISPNNLGDLALHLTYIQHVASGASFWPQNPIFTHGQLTYPLGVDLFNALLVRIGIDPHRSLIAVGLAGAALTGVALWRWGRAIALLALVGNGGLAAVALVVTHELTDFQSTLAWKNLFLALFVTQRGLLFALPAGLLLLASWRARLFGEGEAGRLPPWSELLLYASLPLFHLHSFIFLSLLLASWFALFAPLRQELLRLVGGAFLPATALVLLVTGGLQGSRVLGFKAGWMWDDAAWLTWCQELMPAAAEGLAAGLFWPVNFGFTLPLVAWLAWRLWHSPEAVVARAFFFPAMLIFLLCVFVKFAPWEWDNTKLMIWSWLLVVPLAWERLLASHRLALRAVAVVLLFGSGLLSLAGGLDRRHSGYELASRRTLDEVAKALATLPLEARFIGYPTYNHPILLNGRKMALGYTGHAWSHGLDWQGVATRVDALMNGDADWRAAAVELRVRYLYWGQEERAQYGSSTQPWRESAALVAQGFWGEIYDLQPALQPPQP